MNALQLFKQAGISDYIMDGLKGTGSEAQNYLTRGGAGALAGGLGMGLSSYMGGDKDDPNRKQKALSSGLQGAAMGGGLGLGANALQDTFFNSNSGLPDGLQQLKDRAASKGQKLDTNPFGYNHPVGQTAINLTHGSPETAAAVGGGLGMVGGIHHDERLANKAIEGMKPGRIDNVPVKPGEPPNEFLTELNRTSGKYNYGVKDRIIEKLVNRWHNSQDPVQAGEIKGMAGELGIDQQNSSKGIEALLRKKFNTPGDYAGGMMRDVELNRGQYTPSKTGPITSLLRKINPDAAEVYRSAKGGIINSVGERGIPLGTMRRGIGRAAEYGAYGAAGAFGAQQLGRFATDKYMGMHYSPEQIQAWNQNWQQ